MCADLTDSHSKEDDIKALAEELEKENELGGRDAFEGCVHMSQRGKRVE